MLDVFQTCGKCCFGGLASGIKIATPFPKINRAMAARHSKPTAVLVTMQGHITDCVAISVRLYVWKCRCEVFHQPVDHDSNLINSGNSFSEGRFSSRLTDDSSSGII